VPDALRGLTASEVGRVADPGDPLVIIGGAGTGKSRLLVERFAWLVEQGMSPDSIVVLTHAIAAAEALRAEIETAIDRPYESLMVSTASGLCTRLLRSEAMPAGLDPFLTAVTPADRLAMLIERIDELPLGLHDFQGRPSALLSNFIDRIDLLKEQLISSDSFETWAKHQPAGVREDLDREFAAVYRTHDQMLHDAGTLDDGDLLIQATRLLREREDVRSRIAQRWRHVLVDEFQDASYAQVVLIGLLTSEHRGLTVAGDDDQAIHRFRAAGSKNLLDAMAAAGEGGIVRLEQSYRCDTRVLKAAEAVVVNDAERIDKTVLGRDGLAEDEVIRFWRCGNERAQAQGVAAQIERLIISEGVNPGSIAVLVRSVRREGQAVAVALEERAVPHRIVGAAPFFERAEIRDLLAWLRLLSDPSDASAVVRALARPPVALRSIDIARCTQIARRRKLDMISALNAATESPQIPPEARDRIVDFLKLYRSAAAALDTTRPEIFIHRLIDRLGLRRQQLFAAQADVVQRLINLAHFGDLATAYGLRTPQATPREFGRYIASVAGAGLRQDEAGNGPDPRAVSVMTMHAAKGLEFDHVYVLGLHSARMPGARRRVIAPISDDLLSEGLHPNTPDAHSVEMRRVLYVAMTRASQRLTLAYPAQADDGAVQHPSPFVEEARAAAGGIWEDHEEELFGPAETLHAAFRTLRDELLDTVAQTGRSLGELRFDTDLDVSHAVVRYLELVKLAALIERPDQQSVAEALPAINSRLLQAVTADQREIFLTSAVDDYLVSAERDERRRTQMAAAREEPSLEAFLPRRGDGLVLSASDVETYRQCPLRYKFARIFRIPQEPTIHQRFGILVHQVLERFHTAGANGELSEMLSLLEYGWRRGGFGDSEEERQLRAKAKASLTRYHERFQGESAEPMWFERSFSFKLGPHVLRGRVDRVDRLPDGSYELIDYKTGRPKTRAQLKEDIQLSLYAVGAREAWSLEAATQAYYYVLDDEKVPVERDDRDRDWITETVMEVADGILSQGFEPTPSYAACSICDYRILCPAAEK